MITFQALGVPQPKGSTKSFLHRTTGRVVTISDNDRLAGWERTVALAAKAAGLKPHDGPCCVEATFVFPRPKYHLGKRGLRPSAPMRHTVKPDGDKCLRALLDALTGIAYRDDAQVDFKLARKRWADPGEQPGVSVAVRQESAETWGGK